MKFSENWLRSWVNPAISSDELAHLLTMAGLEVEAVESVAPAFEHVVVAEVIEIVKHPNADRLNVCQVNVGEAEPLTIVCGASNVAVGMRVPCARIGAVLPGDFKIRQAKVRDVASFGMLCSAKELGLAEESDGLWRLPADAPVGQSLRLYLDLDDRALTLKLTPNRSDCSSIRGIARDVAALTGDSLNAPELVPVTQTTSEQWPVRVENTQACPLYCGRIVRGINAAVPTPLWMLQRLERSGIRSISAVVDITNYVLLELGQPMHAFDLTKVSGPLCARAAGAGESLTLLNSQTVTLDTDVLVIADDKGPLALAGIMGGAASGVETTTRDIFLESAFFAPEAIAGRARRFGLATDSSFRFERGVDYAATREALERATSLILDICGGHAGEIASVQGMLPERRTIRLRDSRVSRILGIALTHEQIATLLQRLHFNFADRGDAFDIQPPSFRFDLTIEEDVVEELARIYGYEHIPAMPPEANMVMLPDAETVRPLARIQHLLVDRDYQEIISYAFLDAQIENDLCGNASPVALQNPIASNLAVMRSSLIGGLIEALRFNLNRKQPRVRLFESGACFYKTGTGYGQEQRLAAIAYGGALSEQWGTSERPIDFYDVKADVAALFAPSEPDFRSEVHPALHPGRSARIYLNDQPVGWLGELHPQWCQSYDLPRPPVWFEIQTSAVLDRRVHQMHAIPRFLPVRRDIAVLVDETRPVRQLFDAMRKANAPFVFDIELFDLYRGTGVEPGKKSLAFRVLLQDTQKTLTDAEIDPSMAMLVKALEDEGALQRT
ncbi:MAG: phenylalanine--tRNA ligase subunit beta [Gallionella sp.]|jgi:phenylalanyl-tRNA synthetase beta chain|nr:phenylalanine--tRNA ligase subunit beta [Gallionella sp.]